MLNALLLYENDLFSFWRYQLLWRRLRGKVL